MASTGRLRSRYSSCDADFVGSNRLHATDSVFGSAAPKPDSTNRRFGSPPAAVLRSGVLVRPFKINPLHRICRIGVDSFFVPLLANISELDPACRPFPCHQPQCHVPTR
jgi:hypothetical protein